jgi:hypothetical protein
MAKLTLGPTGRLETSDQYLAGSQGSSDWSRPARAKARVTLPVQDSLTLIVTAPVE